MTAIYRAATPLLDEPMDPVFVNFPEDDWLGESAPNFADLVSTLDVPGILGGDPSPAVVPSGDSGEKSANGVPVTLVNSVDRGGVRSPSAVSN